GFLGGIFSKRGKSANASFLSFGRSSSGKPIQPRYSRPFSSDSKAAPQRSVSFRDPFKKDRKRAAPRYSAPGTPFTPQDRVVISWQRSQNPWPNKRFKSEIKSSSGSPFPKKYYNVRPAYTGTTNFNLATRNFWKNFPVPGTTGKGSGPVTFKQDREKYKNIAKFRGPFRDLRAPKPKPPSAPGGLGPVVWDAKPKPARPSRMSITGMPFTKKDNPGPPRYSQPPFAKKYNVKPRYSGTPTFNLSMREFWERNTRTRAMKDAGPVLFKVEREKYKNIAKYRGPFPDLRTKKKKSPPPKESELGPVVWDVSRKNKPQDVSKYLGPNNGIRISKNTYKKSDSDLAEYLGPHKIKMAKVKGNLHPSYRYKKNVLVKSDFVKDSRQKWNIFWAGINRNQEEPKGVKEKISKPKFDKKEREIWNN
ncbi:MAG: hypothetical protein AAGA85_11055, partial [Bacteroidota bacterium]